MAKLKADWIKEAKALGLEVNVKSTVAELKSAIEDTGVVKQKGTDTREAEVAKAGKRSAKSTRESETETSRKEKASKQDKDETGEVKPKKGPIPITRPVLERRSKKYRAAFVRRGEQEKPLVDAIKASIDTSTTNFDGTIEMHIRLSVDPKQADQNIRDSIVLPNGTGKTVRIAVLAESEDHSAAKDAGADIVGEDDLLETIKAGNIDFDVLVATPKVMAKLGQLAKILGPKGLMPNPKSGTVTNDVAKAVIEAKSGKIEYRVDGQGIIHSPIGKVSFGPEKLTQNAETLLESIKTNKPASIKDTYIISVFVTSTMGPSVKVQM